MIGTKRKTPKPLRRYKRSKSKQGVPHAPNDAFHKAGTHNARHGKMGARERAVYAKLRTVTTEGAANTPGGSHA